MGEPLIPLKALPLSAPSAEHDASVSCDTCSAKCCRLEVMLISDTGVPERFIEEDAWGSLTMARLDDGWCAALDRHTMRCSIYELRPWICREFEMGGPECLEERQADLWAEAH
ncbi:YkgJ family cysteine cluster protein [Pseudomonas sp. nanlin1]|uniref:YkgJ family cysteine cluster protein n=1 Tax=Pseudomonas sp. nanlin1 TaxID=3040605 RepID=UPI00388E5B89